MPKNVRIKIIHLIPSSILIVVLIIAWKRPVVGGIVLIVLSMVFTLFFKTYRELTNFLIISFPLILTGLLFIISDFLLKDIKS
ncbi:DUF7670 domain-containing protein [Desulfocucumis palustris]|uniref:DUF7670 domain-containing protein n=1 Tax=Desulfocucumis palustris TaxID=1898651 RepID=UPI0040392725